MSSINIIFNELFERKKGRKINALTYILLSISINLKHKKGHFRVLFCVERYQMSLICSQMNCLRCFLRGGRLQKGVSNSSNG